MPYGYEMILDLVDCDANLFTEEKVDNFCKCLCAVVEMNPEDFHIWASKPEDFATDPPHLHGVSAVQFITTSTIVVHTLTKLNRVFINLFSCKPFNMDVAAKFASIFFEGSIENSTFLNRGCG